MNSTASSSPVRGALPKLLLHCLGSQAVWNDWQKLLKPCGAFLQPNQADETALLQNRGLVMHMQCLDDAQALETTTEQESNWGMQSITLHAPASGESPWLYDWPFGIQARALNKAEVLQALGACGGEVVMSTKSMTLIDLQGMEGQDGQNAIRAMGAQCDWQGQQLASLTMLRLGEFEPLSAFEFIPKPDRPVGVDQSTPEQSLVHSHEIVCRSGEPTPKTGMYEGLLPVSHPLAASYNKSNMRFYFSQEGVPMIRMGMPDSQQEGLVVWIWRASSAQAMR